jgi:hypothetical protein
MDDGGFEFGYVLSWKQCMGVPRPLVVDSFKVLISGGSI